MSLSEADIEQAVDTFRNFLRGKRLKMTKQRGTLVRVALDKRGHFTADQFHRKLNGDGESISMATVYRGLALMEEAEILEGHDFADGQRRYERAMDREHHDHMICVDCRAVIEFTNDRIESLQHEAAAQHGFTVKDHSLTLFVKCDTWNQHGVCGRREEMLARTKTARDV